MGKRKSDRITSLLNNPWLSLYNPIHRKHYYHYYHYHYYYYYYYYCYYYYYYY